MALLKNLKPVAVVLSALLLVAVAWMGASRLRYEIIRIDGNQVIQHDHLTGSVRHLCQGRWTATAPRQATFSLFRRTRNDEYKPEHPGDYPPPKKSLVEIARENYGKQPAQ